MVAANPLFAGGHFYKKFKATFINDIWPEVLFFTLIALSECSTVMEIDTRPDITVNNSVVTMVSEMTKHSLSISNQMLTVLGTVLGLVISFRTSTAYER